MDLLLCDLPPLSKEELHGKIQSEVSKYGSIESLVINNGTAGALPTAQLRMTNRIDAEYLHLHQESLLIAERPITVHIPEEVVFLKRVKRPRPRSSDLPCNKLSGHKKRRGSWQIGRNSTRDAQFRNTFFERVVRTAQHMSSRHSTSTSTQQIQQEQINSQQLFPFFFPPVEYIDEEGNDAVHSQLNPSADSADALPVNVEGTSVIDVASDASLDESNPLRPSRSNELNEASSSGCQRRKPEVISLLDDNRDSDSEVQQQQHRKRKRISHDRASPAHQS